MSATAPSPSSASKPRGAFILLEGLDRSGKSSQCIKLAEAINNAASSSAASNSNNSGGDKNAADGSAAPPAAAAAAVNMRFPDRTTAIGKMIDEYLRQSKEVDDRSATTKERLVASASELRMH